MVEINTLFVVRETTEYIKNIYLSLENIPNQYFSEDINHIASVIHLFD